MSPPTVVEDLDVLEEGTVGLGPGDEILVLDELAFDRCEEALRDRVVPAIALRLMLQTMPFVSRRAWYSALAYWQPRSE